MEDQATEFVAGFEVNKDAHFRFVRKRHALSWTPNYATKALKAA